MDMVQIIYSLHKWFALYVYGKDFPGFESRPKQEIFFFFKTVQRCFASHPVFYYTGIGVLLLE